MHVAACGAGLIVFLLSAQGGTRRLPTLISLARVIGPGLDSRASRTARDPCKGVRGGGRTVTAQG